MGNMVARGEVLDATIEAVVIRADGTREDLGVISRYERDEPLPPEPPPRVLSVLRQLRRRRSRGA